LFQRAFVSHNVVLKIHVPPAQRQSLAPARARSKEERNDRAKGAAFKVAQNGADLFLCENLDPAGSRRRAFR
jgi:hypothetical protein